MSEILTREEYYMKKGDKKRIYGKEDCPFCFDSKKIWESEYWFIVRNFSPYSGDEDHLMACPKEHKQFSIELTKEEFADLFEIQKFVKEYYGEKQYFSSTRESMGNRSVEHLHMHFIPGKLQGKFLRKMLEGQGFPIKQDLDI